MRREIRLSGLVLLLPMVALLSGCALLFKGNLQMVPIDSTPPGAEIIVNGESMGTTPLELELDVARRHEIVVRLGDREQTLVIENAVGGLWVGVDLAPLAVSGGLLTVNIVALSRCDDPLACIALAMPLSVLIPLTVVSAAPIVVDAATGAWNELSPAGVVVDFDLRDTEESAEEGK